MLNREEILNFLQTNKIFFTTRFHVTKIGLFGSFARNEAREDSDIDILIEYEKDTPNIFELKQELSKFLEYNLKRKVEIAREKYLKPYVRDDIMKETVYV